MDLLSPSFKVCEEIIDYLFLFLGNDDLTREKVIEAVNKTPSYVKKALRFLVLVEVVEENGGFINLKQPYIEYLNKGGSNTGALKISITNNSVFKDYHRILNNGKNQKQAATYVISTSKLDIDSSKLISIMGSWVKYLEKDEKKLGEDSKQQVSEKTSFMWVDTNGILKYDEKKHTDFILDKVKKENKSLGEGSVFVDPERIVQLGKIERNEFDLSKLVRKCEELNIVYSTKCFFSVGMLTRAIIDHIPPIFTKKTFSEVAGNHGTKSFRDSMVHLDKSSRKIADSFLHTQIRRKEMLPTKTQVNFSNDLDVLLSEIVRILS